MAETFDSQSTADLSGAQKTPRPRRRKAAALQYDTAADMVPRVTAKGQDLVADNIVATAREANVPIVEDAALVSALLVLELGDEIPSELYQSVAKILAFLYNLDKKDGLR